MGVTVHVQQTWFPGQPPQETRAPKQSVTSPHAFPAHGSAEHAHDRTGVPWQTAPVGHCVLTTHA